MNVWRISYRSRRSHASRTMFFKDKGFALRLAARYRRLGWSVGVSRVAIATARAEHRAWDMFGAWPLEVRPVTPLQSRASERKTHRWLARRKGVSFDSVIVDELCST